MNGVFKVRDPIGGGPDALAVVVTPELSAEARRCLPHIENESVRYILEKIANCYPAPEEPTLPMGNVECE